MSAVALGPPLSPPVLVVRRGSEVTAITDCMMMEEKGGIEEVDEFCKEGFARQGMEEKVDLAALREFDMELSLLFCLAKVLVAEVEVAGGGKSQSKGYC